MCRHNLICESRRRKSQKAANMWFSITRVFYQSRVGYYQRPDLGYRSQEDYFIVAGGGDGENFIRPGGQTAFCGGCRWLHNCKIVIEEDCRIHNYQSRAAHQHCANSGSNFGRTLQLEKGLVVIHLTDLTSSSTRTI